MNRVLASELLEVFPDEELTSISTPEPDETISEFCNRIGYELDWAEDGISCFLLNEIADLDRNEAIGYLDDTVADFIDLRDRIAAVR